MATISGTINNGITIGTAGTYASPLTVTSTGYVNNSGTTGNGIYGPGTQPWLVYNYGRIREAGNGTAQAGIYFAAGGTVINGTSASISGAVGVWTNGQPSTIDNAGTIAGRNDIGVFLQSGGNVLNNAGGTVVGRVEALSAPATITNAGLIGNPKYAFGAIYLGDGGTVVNQMGGTIGSLTGFYRYGSREAVITAFNAPATIINAGSISAEGAYYAIRVTAGSSVVNQAGGRITVDGFAIIAGYRTNGNYEPVYISNAGYVAGFGGNESGGVIFSPAGTLVNQAGGTIKGGFAGVLFVTGTPGSVGASGTIINAGTIIGEENSVITSTIGPGTVINSGTLSSYGTASVLLGAGDMVLNQRGGVITAAYGTGVILYNGGTVINAAGGYIGGQYGGLKASGGNGFGPPAQASVILNYGRILQAGSGTAQAGIYLTAGGTIINGTSASISGAAGVWITGQAGTVNNSGTITGRGNAGVSLQAGGSVTSQVGGTINGDYYGVLAAGPVTIDNAGYISGSISGGVSLRGGGVVINRSGGRLDGLAEGVLLQGAAATLINAGTVGQPLGLTGVDVSAGGTVINQSGGLITGFNDGIEVRQGTGYILNGGQISGTGMAGAISFFAAAGTVVNQAGGTIKGPNTGIVSIPLGGTSGSQSGLVTVINAGSITAAGYGMYISGGGVVINQATGIIGGTTGTDVVITGGIGTVVNGGTLLAGGTKTTGIILRSGGTVVDSGLISAAGGTAIAFGGSITNRLLLLPSYAISGSVIGSTTAGAGNTLELGSASAVGSVSGLGSKFTNFGTLAFDAGAQWTAEGNRGALPAVIVGFTASDTIDLDGFVAVSDTFANNALVLTDAVARQATLGIQGIFSTDNFIVTADGAGGTDIGMHPSVRWVGGNGNWNTGSLWNTGSPPGSTTDAILANPGTATITNGVTVNSITTTKGAVVASAPGQTITIYGNVAGANNYFGSFSVDAATGQGGTGVRIGGTLGYGVIGNGNLSAPTMVAAHSLGLGVNITGNISSGNTNQATLYISSAAPPVAGNIKIIGDAMLEFASGGFTTIGGLVYLSGPQARITNPSDPLTNSALTNLSSNRFDLILENRASAATNAGLNFTNYSELALNTGATLSIGGTLINPFRVEVDNGVGLNATPPGASTLIAAGLQNTGVIWLIGDYYHPNDPAGQARVIINSAAPTTWAGLGIFSTNALLQFQSGGIQTIASGARIGLYGNSHLADAADPSSDGALSTLQTNLGLLDIDDSNAAFDPAGTLVNSYGLTIDNIANVAKGPASRVSFGSLVNTSYVGIGFNSSSRPSATSVITIQSLTNTGQMLVFGNQAFSGDAVGPVVNIAGGLTNSGLIELTQVANLNITDPGVVKNTGTIVAGGTNVTAITLQAGGTVFDAGNISAVTGTAIGFGGGSANRLVLYPSYTIAGTVAGSTIMGASNTLELGSASAPGIVSGLGAKFTNFGMLDFDTGARWTAAGSVGALPALIAGFTAGDTIDLGGFVAVSDTFADNALVLTDAINNQTTLGIQGNFSTGDFTVTADGQGGTEVVVCFCRGTMIRTERGEVAVEELAVGNRAETLSGAFKPIVWIGMGRDLVTRTNRLARPVIVRRGALGDEVPSRDLYVTHGHSLYLDGVLIPVEHLINHRSILWDDTAQVVEYYHIELEHHDVVWANGAAAETYYDASNRALFQNVRAGSTPGAVKPTFAPVETRGDIVEHIWAKLHARAGLPAVIPTTDDPDLHLVVGGERVDAVSVREGIHLFELNRPPEGPIRLRSRCGVPSLMGLNRHEHRRIGIALRQIVINGRGVMTCLDADAALLADAGCYPAENGFCWTDGAVELPAAAFAAMRGGFSLLVQISDEGMRYPLSEAVSLAA